MDPRAAVVLTTSASEGGRRARGRGEAPARGERRAQYVAINGKVSVWLRKLLGWQERDTTLILTDANTKDLEQLASMADGTGPFGRTKRLAPVIFKTFPFAPDAVDEGFVLLKSRRVVGKVVFDMSRSS